MCRDLRSALLLAIALTIGCTGVAKGRENTQDYIAEKLKPKDLVLSRGELVLTANIASPTVTATVSGAIENCTANPPLPTGLTLDPKSCTISGTPTSTQLAVSHTISAQNEFGSSQASIAIIVNSTLAFARTNYDAAIIAAITPITPTSSSAITSCSVTPPLPTGISFASTSCSITGSTPGVSGPTTYTVTASDGAQTATTSVTIEFGKVTYSWGAATDNANGRVTYVMSATPPSGFSAGATVTLAKCSLGQTWQSASNSCSGSPVAYTVSNAQSQCTAAGGSLPQKSQLQIAIHCSDKTYAPDEYGNCGAGNYANPAVSSLFPGTQAATYWTRQQDSDQVCGAWCQMQVMGYYYIDFSSSSIWRDSSTTNTRFVRCRF